MNPDLDDLTISNREIEGLIGLEMNDIFIGGVLGGTYRWSVLQQPKRLFSFCVTQFTISILVFIFSLPFGLILIRNTPQAVNDLPTISRFLQVTVGMTAIFMVSWNIYMRVRANSFKTLAHLLTEVDKYNDVLQAMDVLDQLETVSNPEQRCRDRPQVIEALTITRNSLVCGLMTERILRANRKLIARRYDLCDTIEANLMTLQTMTVNQQANEYVELLNAAIQIGITVQQEVRHSLTSNPL